MMAVIVPWIRMSAASMPVMSRHTTTAPTTCPFCWTGTHASSVLSRAIPGGRLPDAAMPSMRCVSKEP